MTYEIRRNEQYNSTEVYFDSKPSDAVREALKAKRFRWHSTKRCWYGYASEEVIAEAITATSTDEEPACVVGDGYLGGGAVYGSKSHIHLYGADLSAAVREDIKKAGIKGTSCKIDTYSGGQNLTVTVKMTASDFVSFDQYLNDYRIDCGVTWIYLSHNQYIISDKYWNASVEEQERIRREAAAFEYANATTCESDYHNIKKSGLFTAAAQNKINKIESIVCAYRYDCSNSMVDYFDTNFYYDIRIRPVCA